MPLDATGVLRNSKDTLDPADDAANGTSSPTAHSGFLLSAAYNALRLNSGRQSENSQTKRVKQSIAACGRQPGLILGTAALPKLSRDALSAQLPQMTAVFHDRDPIRAGT